MTDVREPGSEPTTSSTTTPAGATLVEDRAGDRRRRKQPRSIARRISFWLGMALLGAGLGLLGYVAWQLWGTNWLSWRAQREVTSQLEQEWASGTAKEPRYVPRGEASALIRIPKFGKDYVVPVLEGSSEDILAKGFAHFDPCHSCIAPSASGVQQPTAEPGDLGNYAIAAHRVTHGEPLRNMPDLRPGDTVIVETVDHRYIYKLDTNPNDLVIPFTGTWVLNAFPKNPSGGVGPLLKPDKRDPSCMPSPTVHCAGGGLPGDPANMYQRVLMMATCSEIFHTDNRMIVFGHLIEVVDKPKATPHPVPTATPTKS